MRVTRCTYILMLVSVLVSYHAAHATRPNVVIIYADDHAQNAVGCYGSKINGTANIDQLAAEGMRFTQSFVANSICGPARATLLTGLHSHANGQTSNRGHFRDDLPTFIKRLDAGGYETAMIGKWHLSSPPNGFDYWAIKQGDYYNPTFKTPTGVEAAQGYVTDLITDRSLDWIADRANPANPFCLWISHAAVHRTWTPPLRYLNRYTDADIAEPTTLLDDYDGRAAGAAAAQMRIARDMFPAYDLKLPVTGSGILDAQAQRQLDAMTPDQRTAWDAAFTPRNRAYAEAELTGDALTRWNYQRYIKNYLRCVDAIDESVGRVRSFLQQHGLANNTIVIYTSDQGFFLGEHGWYDKRWMYEPSLGTPLIVSWPGKVKAGTTSDAMVQNIDIAPTILEVCGLSAEPEMHGRSLVPLLRGESPANWRDAIYYHYQMAEKPSRTAHLVARHYGIRTQRYKLVYFYDLDAWELYDLQADPDEVVNLVADADHAEVRDRLRGRLDELRNEFGDNTGGSLNLSDAAANQ